MKLTAGNFVVEVVQVPEKGTSWEVRTFRKAFGFKKRISSDWFIDGTQAKKFAAQLVKDLQDNRSTNNLTQRKPGWTLHRSAH